LSDPDPPASPPPPPDLVALQRADGDVVILSFTLPNGDSGALSPAESHVMQHLLEGRTNAEIAALRATSPRTVANQIASLFRKLGVSSRLELVATAPFVSPSRPPGPRRGT
jgi:DNA-binding CsgD family transcriptional regulator